MPQTWAPVKDLANQVQTGQTKASDLVNRSLQAIEENSEYKAIIATTAERAKSRAKDLDEQVTKGQSIGRLAGVPFIAKDNFLSFGSETTAASNMLKGFKAPYQASAIERLEAEGAICVAKANLDAFAHGASTENSDFFTTKNPADKARVPGGSSGGPAAAVVLELAPFALGTDTGGSIRQPASFCGCVGYKPTYGLVSRSGVVAMASSTDVIGPLAKTVEDASLVLDVMAGPDSLDSTTIERQDSYTQLDHTSLKGQKFGVIKEYMSDGLSSEVRVVIEAAIDKLKQAGAIVSEVSLPSLDMALAIYYILCPAEISSNLSRYDGQRFGYSDPKAKDLEASYLNSRGQGFGKEAKRRIIIGTYVLSSGYYDAYYKQAQIARSKLISEFETAISGVDYLIGPVAPTVAFKIGQNTQDPLQMYLCDVMTVSASLIGNPAISLPAGRANNLPVGLQVMAAKKADKQLLSIAKQLEGLLS